MEWLPIDTVPRDCTPVLVFRPPCRLSAVGTVAKEWFGPRSDWWDKTLMPYTHWMPIPAHPKAEADRV